VPQQIATQFWPWESVNKLLEYGEIALKKYPFSHLWVCDEFQYEDTQAILTAMAMKFDAIVGPMVTFPWRNPLEMAQRYSTIAKLSKSGKGVAIGLGGGGAVQVGVINEKANRLSVIKETLILMRELFAGNSVPLSGYPELSKRFRYNTKNSTRLYFPPPQPIPVYLGIGGPKISEVAGEFADGIIVTQLQVSCALRGAKAGTLKELLNRVDVGRQRPHEPRPFKKIYAFHLSVSKDAERAKQWGKRNTSYALSGQYLRYADVLQKLGIDTSAISYVAEAYQKGLGLEEAVKRVSDELLMQAGVVTCGTPSQVIEQLLELKKHLVQLGFDQWTFGVPLGPDVPEAIDLITREVIPAVVSG
jgi:5,10-methylenetetrahydromethanopterin reductase